MRLALPRHWLVLFAAMLAGGGLSLLLGRELNWDLANYHFYQPYAFLHDRSALDYWPSSFLQQFLNPLLDVPSYFLIQYFSVRATIFILGAIHGINLYLLFLLADKYLGDRLNTLIIFFIALVGICGPIAFPSIGSFQNDCMVSIPVLAFLILSYDLKPHQSLFWGSLCLGIACALKLTSFIFLVGSLIAFLLLSQPLRSRLKLCLLLLLGCAAGYLLFGGFWMYHLWVNYHNPVFPFFNNIFQSPFFPQINWLDNRFKPEDTLTAIFYPFFYAWNGRISDVPFQDFRMAVIYSLIAVACIWHLLRPRSNNIRNEHTRFLTVFFITSYIIWQHFFSIARYMLTLEILTPLLGYLLVEYIFNNTKRAAFVIVILFAWILIVMQPARFTRVDWFAQTYFNILLPPQIKHIDQADVLVAYPAYTQDNSPRPQNYLIPFFPAKWRFTGIPFSKFKYQPDTSAEKMISQRIKQAHHAIFLLSEKHSMPEFYAAAATFGLVADGKCLSVYSDREAVTGQPILLCPVKLI